MATVKTLQRAGKIQVQNERGEWIDQGAFTTFCYNKEPLKELSFEFPAPAELAFTTKVENCDVLVENCDVLKEFFNSSPAYEIRYRIGDRWFMPVFVLSSVHLKEWTKLCLGDDGVTAVSLSLEALGAIVKYSNKFARPVFWLWKQWWAVKRFIRGRVK